MTVLDTIVRGAQAFRGSVTLDNINLSQTGFGRSIDLVGNRSSTFEELYRTQPWVQIVINRLARSASRFPLKVLINPDEPDARERVRSGPLYDVLTAPEPHQGQTHLKLGIMYNALIHGNAIVIPANRPRVGAPPTELITTSSAHWHIERERDTGEAVYFFQPWDGTPIPFRQEEVIHFKWWAGGNGLWAASALEALRTTLMNEDAAQRLVISSFEKGVRPSGVVSLEGNPDKDTIDRTRDSLQKTFGGVDNAAKMAILTAGAKWMPMSHTLVDSALEPLRKMNREEVAAAFNVPAPMVGILDHATFSNIETQHLMELQDTLDPWLNLIQDTFTAQLIRREPMMEGQFVEFDRSALLRGDPVKSEEATTRAVGGPWKTVNEGRALHNLPRLPDAIYDRVLTPSNMAGQEATDGQ